MFPLVAGGCASEPPEQVWWQPGYSADQFAIDRSDCWASARVNVQMPTPTYLDVMQKKKLQRKFVVGCLYTKGYRQYRLDELAPEIRDSLEV